MTRLLQKAFEAVNEFPPDEQDEYARSILDMVAERQSKPVPLTPEQQESIRISMEQVARGEFATHAQIEAIWAKYR